MFSGKNMTGAYDRGGIYLHSYHPYVRGWREMRRAAKTRDDLVNLICDSADVRYRSLDVKFVQNLSIFAWVEMCLICLQKVSGIAAVTVVGG